MFKVISGTLLANRNTIEFTDETISNNSIFEVYADQPDVIPVSVTVGGTTASITFDVKASVNTGIKVLVNNIEGEFAPDTIDAENVSYINGSIGVTNSKDALDRLVNMNTVTLQALSTLNTKVDERVPEDTTLGGVLYHATTGNTWKKLDASNIDYDSGSTIYSAMGDIDVLTTTATNIVGAINELNNKPSGGYDITTEETKTGKKLFGKDVYIKAYPFNGSIPTSGANLGSSVFDNISDINNVVSAYTIRTQTLSTTPLAVYTPSVNTLNCRGMYGITSVNDMYIILEYTKVGV